MKAALLMTSDGAPYQVTTLLVLVVLICFFIGLIKRST